MAFTSARGPCRRATAQRARFERLVERGYDACEIDLGDGFWMDWDFARRLGEAARQARIRVSIHAPLAAFLGHVESHGRKHQMAVGMLDHTAGLAQACGAAPVVIHPGFLLGRTREAAIGAVVQQLAELGRRLESKGRLVPVRDRGDGSRAGSGLSTTSCYLASSSGCGPFPISPTCMRRSDGGFTTVERFAAALESVDRALPPDVPFHIHFSDVSYANRNEKAHIPYSQGTLRAEPLAEALARFTRPATVISESPDEASHQAIRAILARPSLQPQTSS